MDFRRGEVDFRAADAGEEEDFCRNWQEGRLVSCSSRNMQDGHKLAPPEILPRFMLSFKREVSGAPPLDERQAEKCEKSATSLCRRFLQF